MRDGEARGRARTGAGLLVLPGSWMGCPEEVEKQRGHFSIDPAFPWAHPIFNFSAISSSIWSSIE